MHIIKLAIRVQARLYKCWGVSRYWSSEGAKGGSITTLRASNEEHDECIHSHTYARTRTHTNTRAHRHNSRTCNSHGGVTHTCHSWPIYSYFQMDHPLRMRVTWSQVLCWCVVVVLFRSPEMINERENKIHCQTYHGEHLQYLFIAVKLQNDILNLNHLKISSIMWTSITPHEFKFFKSFQRLSINVSLQLHWIFHPIFNTCCTYVT